MLASLARSSCALVCRSSPVVKRRVSPKAPCPGSLGRVEVPISICSQPTVQAFGTISTKLTQDLKAQIIAESQQLNFRYEIDNHKTQSLKAIRQAEQAIGYKFQHRQLLRTAFVHTSASTQCNIRLAWVGDAVLQLVITEGLLSRYPAASMGDKAKLRSSMLNRSSCFKYAQQLGLSRWLLVGNALERLLAPGDKFPYPSSIMSELFEAVLGAIYLDGGLVKSHAWFAKQIGWPATFEAAVKQYNPKQLKRT